MRFKRGWQTLCQHSICHIHDHSGLATILGGERFGLCGPLGVHFILGSPTAPRPGGLNRQWLNVPSFHYLRRIQRCAGRGARITVSFGFFGFSGFFFGGVALSLHIIPP